MICHQCRVIAAPGEPRGLHLGTHIEQARRDTMEMER
jgi:hypothetical protein